ncbi:SRPBCC family protein [Devosia sediminis]|uniref:SRPBCC family protein n=1 Tax=Devosia sediminis TaxID=2798801 RepID=A0A934MLJ9_9HYPH|nr:SRPBCC family protein [Devosia sediminis]MBJ3784711.1 SRPBCC family protein [Devosia sediminis]
MFHKTNPIDADPVRVFNALTDIAAIPHWIPTIRSARLLSPGPLGQETRFTQDAVIGSWYFPIDGVVRQYNRPYQLDYEYERGVMAGYWSYVIVPADHGTILETRIEFSAPRLLRPLLGKIVSGNLDNFAKWAASRTCLPAERAS